jgi:hypothetical protein
VGQGWGVVGLIAAFETVRWYTSFRREGGALEEGPRNRLLSDNALWLAYDGPQDAEDGMGWCLAPAPTWISHSTPRCI